MVRSEVLTFGDVDLTTNSYSRAGGFDGHRPKSPSLSANHTGREAMFEIDDLFGVTGKTVLITGGGSGIGKAIATAFLVNGATVFITGRRADVLRDTTRELSKTAKGPGTIDFIQGDVSSKQGCESIASVLRIDHLDTLVNCAGVSMPWRRPADPRNGEAVLRQMVAVTEYALARNHAYDSDDFNYTNSINVNGVYFMTTAVLPLLAKSSGGNVLVISSILGLGNSRVSSTMTYGVSKAASIQLGKMLAGRLSPFKIRVNIICPGIFPSEMTGVSDAAAMDDAAAKTASRSPMGRAGTLEEIVGPVLLLSSKAGGYCNASVLTVDGGRLMSAGIDDGLGKPQEQLAFP